MSRLLPNLAALADLHDVFLVDQFGVLHDGSTPYPGAIEALSSLKAAGKTVVLLSNSGKRSAVNEVRLVGLGFRPGSWDLFLTSGEVAWRRLRAETPSGRRRRCLLIARDGDRSAVTGLDLDIVTNPAEADVVLLSGSEGDIYTLEDYHDLLADPARRGVECLCTNPDKIMLTSVGPRFGAGRIAELYQAMGGPVTWIGKPFPEIYAAALHAVGDPDPARVVGVGDSVEHDIAGARSAGARSALVRTGVLTNLSDQEIDQLEQRHGAVADYVLASFRWRNGK
jgi:HAD superfamily hydrolase (TIGR01459 family)